MLSKAEIEAMIKEANDVFTRASREYDLDSAHGLYGYAAELMDDAVEALLKQAMFRAE